MAYPISPGAILEMTLITELHGQRCMNTFHYRKGPGTLIVDDDVMLTFCQTFDARVWEKLRLVMSVQVVNAQIMAQWIRPTRYRPYMFLPSLTSGNLAPKAEPSGCTAVLKRFTDESGRKNQGRIYVPGVPDDFVNMSRLTTAAITAYANAWGQAGLAELEDPELLPYPPVLISAKAPFTSVQITRTSVNTVVCYQRRREVGRGV